MRIAPQVVLNREQRAKLEAYARGRKIPARVVLRARIVLLTAEGTQDLKIARLLSIVPRTAARWRSRFLRDGIAGLEHDAPRPGRTPSISPELVRMVIAKTTQERPSHATHWSTRTMAAVAGISEASVRRIWHGHGLKPHRVETLKLSNDSRFAEKLEDIVGLYLNPPEHALVLSRREKGTHRGTQGSEPRRQPVFGRRNPPQIWRVQQEQMSIDVEGEFDESSVNEAADSAVRGAKRGPP